MVKLLKIARYSAFNCNKVNRRYIRLGVKACCTNAGRQFQRRYTTELLYTNSCRRPLLQAAPATDSSAAAETRRRDDNISKRTGWRQYSHVSTLWPSSVDKPTSFHAWSRLRTKYLWKENKTLAADRTLNANRPTLRRRASTIK